MPRKAGRESNERPGRSKKRKFSGNQFTYEQETEFTSVSAQKLKTSDDDEVIIDATHGYRILHFVSVFTALSQMVICETCKKRVTFNETNNQGVGFKLVVICECERRYIESSPRVNNRAYAINRQMVLVMRLLGVGREGLNLFCNLMDISSGFSKSLYYAAMDNIHCATSAIFYFYVKKAVEEEKERNVAAGNPESHLTISDDGSWKKREFASLIGVVTLIGRYSKKVIDLVVKSSYCKRCENWKGKEDTEEYIEWYKTHKNECSINHTGSAEKMEPDAVGEMFLRSEERYKVKYVNYIGDGDSKTFKHITDLKPYGDKLIPTKKERCLSENTQNNESFNATVWQLAPQHQHCGEKIVEISAFLAAALFNVGYNAILKTFMTMGIKIGPICKIYAERRDEQRIWDAERRHSSASKEARREAANARKDLHEEMEGLLYGPGIAE